MFYDPKVADVAASFLSQLTINVSKIRKRKQKTTKLRVLHFVPTHILTSGNKGVFIIRIYIYRDSLLKKMSCHPGGDEESASWVGGWTVYPWTLQLLKLCASNLFIMISSVDMTVRAGWWSIFWSSWWFFAIPIWEICSTNWIISPGRGENNNNIWNQHLVICCVLGFPARKMGIGSK